MTLRLWFDGRCLQTASHDGLAAKTLLGLIEALASDRPEIELCISFDAAMPDAAVAARTVVGQWIEASSIQVWHSVAAGSTARERQAAQDSATGRRLSELALAYHVDRIAPSFAVVVGPGEHSDDRAIALVERPRGSTPIVGVVGRGHARSALREGADAETVKAELARWDKFSLVVTDDSRIRDALRHATGRPPVAWVGPSPNSDLGSDIVVGDAHDRSSPVPGDSADQRRFARQFVEALPAVAPPADPVGGPAAALRRSYGELVRAAGLHRDLAARTLTLAEPQAAVSSGRLIIDATSTMLHRHQTGIQRVVGKTVDALFDPETGSDQQVVLSYCDGPDGWFDAGGSLRAPPDKASAFALVPRSGDRLLMLDSSWQFHAAQRPFFLAARLRGAEIVSCLYDLVPLATPGFCSVNMPVSFAAWFQTALAFSTGFVCISKAVADQLRAWLTAIAYPRPMKIGHWRLGADFALTEPPGNRPVPAVGQNSRPLQAITVLMVGTVEPRKGYAIALDAFERLWREAVPLRLVIVGKRGWGVDDLVARLRSNERFGADLVWHERADDLELARLYAEADVLLSTSYAEGFGLPIVEAGHFGKPVIASDIPVFREVTASAPAATFFPVGSADGLRSALLDHVRRRGNPFVAGDRWPGWKESAAELRAVLDGRWSAPYVPPRPGTFTSLADIGRTAMTRPLTGEECRHDLRLIEQRLPTVRGETARFLVALDNRSACVWAGQAQGSDGLSVALRGRSFHRDGRPAAAGKRPVRIPFVLPPGETCIMAVEIPAGPLPGLASKYVIEVGQIGFDPWGPGLTIEAG